MSLLVVIPAFNEEKSLSNVIRDVRSQIPQASILVVDDGSQDSTADVAKSEGVSVVSLPFNVGVGGALRVGFLYAHRNSFSQVLQIDADGQHKASEANLLLKNSKLAAGLLIPVQTTALVLCEKWQSSGCRF